MSDPVQPSLMEQLRPVISDERLGTYLSAAGYDPDRALSLYLWNAEVGEAFHLSIQAVEVALRNRVATALQAEFGVQWWESQPLLSILDEDRKADLALVQKRIRNRKLALNSGQIVAGLSFGFWVGMLQRRYNPALWSGRLRTSFPDLPPNRNRASVAQAASRTAWLRNRIWHHEPIIRLDLSAEYGSVMTLLAWLSASKASWVKTRSRVPSLLRNKP